MSNKILIAYASKAGSTAGVAQAIGETLAASGAAIEVLPVKEVQDVQAYRAVVLGRAVKFGQWLPEAVKFVEKNQAVLKQIPTAFFAVHLMNMGDDEASRKNRALYLEPVHKLVTPGKEAFFAGVGDRGKVSFIEGIIGRMVKSPEGDFRDWQAIRAWAQELAHAGFAA